MLDKSEMKPVGNSSDSSNKRGNFSEEEIAKFDALAESWWDPNGDYKTALDFNEARVEYFIQQLCIFFERDRFSEKPLKGLSILDVGCGGGLVCEPLAMAGATVTGIDVSEMSVEVAKRHALKSNLDIDYIHAHAQEFADKHPRSFDVVINAEVIEHVPNQKDLVANCGQLVKIGGCVIMATLNRTIKSFFVGIVGAEYIMRYLPRGTHSWHLFVTPFELNSMASIARMRLKDEIGMSYSLIAKRWSTCKSLGVNYIQIYEKLGSIRD